MRVPSALLLTAPLWALAPTGEGARAAHPSAPQRAAAPLLAEPWAELAALAPGPGAHEERAVWESWRAAAELRAAQADVARALGEPQPPALEPLFRTAFERLAAEGSPKGMLWCLEHFRAARRLGQRRLAPEERAQRLALYRALIGTRADDAALLDPALFDLLERDDDLPLEGLADLLALLDRCSRSDELRARGALVLVRRTAPQGSADPRARESARRILAELAERFPRTRAAADAREALWHLEHLAVGRLAPDFTTYDGAGNEIRLSDYRSQVVVVRFWNQPTASPPAGSTTGSAPHPLDRAADLERRLWDHRFTWIGVAADPDRETFRRDLVERGLRSTNQAWEGGARRGAARAWHVDRGDATYVLDHTGVVRGVDLEGEELERLIDLLLDELRAQVLQRQRHLPPRDGGDPSDR